MFSSVQNRIFFDKNIETLLFLSKLSYTSYDIKNSFSSKSFKITAVFEIALRNLNFDDISCFVDYVWKHFENIFVEIQLKYVLY